MEMAYAQAVALKRRQLWLGLLLLAVLVLLSSHVAEISFSKLYQHIGGFASYIDRILHLENGRPVISDPAEWFWGWKKWLALMGETLLMAYLGTLLGAIAALILCFLASQNLTQSKGVVFFTVEDEWGVANLVLYPDLARQFRAAVVGARLVVAEGRVERVEAAVPIIHLIVRKLIDRSELLADLAALDDTQGRADAHDPWTRSLARADEVRRPDLRGDPEPRVKLPASRDFH